MRHSMIKNCTSVDTFYIFKVGWSGGAMVLGKLPVPGRPTILITVGQGPIALAVGAGGGGLDIFTLIYPFSFLSPSLWETARYRLKYCLKGPLSPKQPTNQHIQGLPCRFVNVIAKSIQMSSRNHYTVFIPRHTLVAGYYVFMLAVRVSVRP